MRFRHYFPKYSWSLIFERSIQRLKYLVIIPYRLFPNGQGSIFALHHAKTPFWGVELTRQRFNLIKSNLISTKLSKIHFSIKTQRGEKVPASQIGAFKKFLRHAVLRQVTPPARLAKHNFKMGKSAETFLSSKKWAKPHSLVQRSRTPTYAPREERRQIFRAFRDFLRLIEEYIISLDPPPPPPTPSLGPIELLPIEP